jgi:O-acetyl-ADP-ribose deacetylase (regulator of RNase III)
MFVIEKQGNLLELFDDGDFDIIIQQCNCLNLMGAGIAAAIAHKYPEAQRVDSITSCGDINKLGTYSIAKINDKQSIVNLYSQYHIGIDKWGNIPTSYMAMEEGLYNLSQELKRAYKGKVNFPRIGTYQLGCNRGGADWSKVRKIIQSTLHDFPVSIIT